MSITPSKREQAAQLSAKLGLTGLLEILPERPGLLILNYHRIGDPEKTPYDPGTFTATTEEFDAQIALWKKRFPIVTLAEALAIIQRKKTIRRTHVLITFDDGYLDNYQEAFPVLRAHGASAVFFLPTYFIGTGHVPWWDAIAYVVKQSGKRRIELTFPRTVTFDIDRSGMETALRDILTLAAAPESQNPETFLSHLETVCETSRPQGEAAERCFLNWDEAREMLKNGMDFGSHTHSHEILSTLSAADQQKELSESRSELTKQLGQSIDTLAYPVGLRHTFTAETIEVAKAAGYQAAFSFYGGLNLPGRTEAFDIRRYPVVWGNSLNRLRLQTAWVSALGETWF